ncbi:MAG: hypothetical protein A2017_05535 [Lentisphaerae bacterium GWF2_44_16]|nr:MAG: hypothetical protein A2017_05535 [Lentisphaerae bacterium GWF2_44_16]
MYATKDDLLSGCLAEMPVKDFTLSNGQTVKIRALKGSTRTVMADHQSTSDKIQTGLAEGLVEPRLLPKEIRKFIDYNADIALEIFHEIAQFSGEYSTAEKTEKETAEKN